MRQLRCLELPTSVDTLFMNDYVKQLTACMLLRPCSMVLTESDIQVVHWVVCFMATIIPPTLKCRVSDALALQYSGHSLTCPGNTDRAEAMSASVHLICAILERWHLMGHHPGYPSLVTGCTDDTSPVSMGDIMTVMFQTLGYIHDMPGPAAVWPRVQTTFATITPERNVSSYPETDG
jgi:hypothetical protein